MLEDVVVDVCGAGAAAASVSGSAARATAGSTQQHPLRAEIIAFYEKHNPAKGGDVDALLIQYEGNEGALWDRLIAKYAGEGGAKAAAGAGGGGATASSDLPATSSSLAPVDEGESKRATDAAIADMESALEQLPFPDDEMGVSESKGPAPADYEEEDNRHDGGGPLDMEAEMRAAH